MIDLDFGLTHWEDQTPPSQAVWHLPLHRCFDDQVPSDRNPQESEPKNHQRNQLARSRHTARRACREPGPAVVASKEAPGIRSRTQQLNGRSKLSQWPNRDNKTGQLRLHRRPHRQQSMRINRIIQQAQEKRIPNHHITRNNDRHSKARTQTHRVPRHYAARRTKRHDRNQRQKNRRRQTPIIRDTPFRQHNHARAAQHHAPHQPDPPEHVREDGEAEAPGRRARERDLRNERQVRDCGRALVRDLLDLVEGFGFDVAREGEEARDGEQGEGGEEDEVEDEHDCAEYAESVELPG